MIQMVYRSFFLFLLIINIFFFEGTFNTYNLVEEYVERILKPYLLSNKLKKGLVILDQATCHKTSIFQTALTDLNIEYIYVPARLTGIYP